MCEQTVPGLRGSLALLSASLEAGQGALQPQNGRALSPPLLLLREVVCVGASPGAWCCDQEGQSPIWRRNRDSLSYQETRWGESPSWKPGPHGVDSPSPLRRDSFVRGYHTCPHRLHGTVSSLSSLTGSLWGNRSMNPL